MNIQFNMGRPKKNFFGFNFKLNFRVNFKHFKKSRKKNIFQLKRTKTFNSI